MFDGVSFVDNLDIWRVRERKKERKKERKRERGGEESCG